MSAGSTQRLVQMANQIAAFFLTQPGASAPLQVADHLNAFWDPAMRRAIVAHLDQGGAGLDPLARDAVGLVKTTSAARVERALARAGQDSPGHRPGDDAG